MTRGTYQRGVDAEIMVMKHYEKSGFKLIKHRYKTIYGEIDVIMQNEDIIVFIEVKSRVRPMHQEFLTRRQMKRCTDAALHYISTLDSTKLNMMMRFDAVTVINNKIDKVFENAWASEC